MSDQNIVTMSLYTYDCLMEDAQKGKRAQKEKIEDSYRERLDRILKILVDKLGEFYVRGSTKDLETCLRERLDECIIPKTRLYGSIGISNP